MSFPVYIHIGSMKLHPHLVFEALAYFIGFRFYLFTRNKAKIPVDKAISVLVGAIVGAAVGSKLLYWLEDPQMTASNAIGLFQSETWQQSMSYFLGGKTIVGGLLGGLIGVEWTKKMIGWTRSTGDDYALPLIIGMSIGRIGCFLTGLSDHTYGTPTNWITGIDFGDGIPRHPAPLYEIAFLCILALFLIAVKTGRIKILQHAPEGARFQMFMVGYLSFRLLIDFIKPTIHPYFGLNNVQVACLSGLIYYAFVVRRWSVLKGEMIVHG
jgi:phosphatidylglycerol---prolipoprotein diacylglyceryl transferase